MHLISCFSYLNGNIYDAERRHFWVKLFTILSTYYSSFSYFIFFLACFVYMFFPFIYVYLCEQQTRTSSLVFCFCLVETIKGWFRAISQDSYHPFSNALVLQLGLGLWFIHSSRNSGNCNGNRLRLLPAFVMKSCGNLLFPMIWKHFHCSHTCPLNF